MKTTIFGLIVLSAVLIVPAYADDYGGGGYEAFTVSTTDTINNSTAETTYAFLD